MKHAGLFQDQKDVDIQYQITGIIYQQLADSFVASS